MEIFDSEFVKVIGGLVAVLTSFVKFLEFTNSFRDRLNHDIRREVNAVTEPLPNDQHEHLLLHATCLRNDWTQAWLSALLLTALALVAGPVLLIDQEEVANPGILSWVTNLDKLTDGAVVWILGTGTMLGFGVWAFLTERKKLAHGVSRVASLPRV